MTAPAEFGAPFLFHPKGAFKGLVLFALSEKPMHGYEIMKTIESRFRGFYKPSAGAMYPALRSLRRAGLVIVSGGERRKVYRMTAKGRAFLHGRRAEMEKRYREIEAEVGPEKAALFRDFRRTARLLMPNIHDLTPAQAVQLSKALAELREKIAKILAE